MDVIFGAGKLDQRVGKVESPLCDWRKQESDWGQLYQYEPVTPKDRVLVEDLAVTMLNSSRVAARDVTAVYRNGASRELSSLPDKPFEETTGDRHDDELALPWRLRGNEDAAPRSGPS